MKLIILILSSTILSFGAGTGKGFNGKKLVVVGKIDNIEKHRQSHDKQIKSTYKVDTYINSLSAALECLTKYSEKNNLVMNNKGRHTYYLPNEPTVDVLACSSDKGNVFIDWSTWNVVSINNKPYTPYAETYLQNNQRYTKLLQKIDTKYIKNK